MHGNKVTIQYYLIKCPRTHGLGGTGPGFEGSDYHFSNKKHEEVLLIIASDTKFAVLK